MPTILKTKNSVTTTVVPTTLQQGELAVNITDKKMWVGNAATTPVQLLGGGVTGDVVGPASATDNALARFDATTGKLIQNSVGILSDAGALTGITDFTYTGTLTGGTGIVNLGSGQFYKAASGAISLGTTSVYGTNSRLSVLGSVTANDTSIVISDAATTTIGLALATPSSGSVPYIFGNTALAFGSNGAERMRITSAGNALFRLTDAAVYDNNTGGDVSNYWNLQTASTTGTVARALLGSAGFGGYFGGSYPNSSGKSIISGTIGIFASSNTAGSESGFMVFSTKPTSGDATERMRIDSSGNVLVGGTTQRLSAKITNNGSYWAGSGNSSGDAEYFLSNYATPTVAWGLSVRQDIGGANNDLKFLRLNSSGVYQGIAMQITQAEGNVKFVANLGIGDATPTTSGTGITFPATQSASSNANTLDDYEEGTWSPTVFIGATEVTSYHFQNGSYTRVGRIVHANCWVRVNVKGAATGSVSIRGLPFNIANSNANFTAGTIGYQDEMLLSSAPMYCYGAGNSATVNLVYASATSGTDVTQANLNNGQFMMQISYATST
jgi:hypothetical protein